MGQINKVAEAFETIKQAMIEDNPSEPGSYAHTWHCNIAMAFIDEINRPTNGGRTTHSIGNDAASRFMRRCFDVETKA